MFPLIVLQLITFPIISSKVEADQFGEILFFISVFTIISFPIGNVINNVKLLTYSKYSKNNEQGDFGLIITISIGLAIIFYTFFLATFNINAHYIYMVIIISLSILI